MTTDSSNMGALFGALWFAWACGLIWVIIAIIGYWKMFTKAGEAGWKSIIPIWNTLVWLKIIGRPWWWILLFLIPVVNVVILVICAYDTALSYGHGFGFTLGLVFLQSLFLVILGWGDSKYVGPRGMAPAFAGAPAGGAAVAGAAAMTPPIAPAPPMAAPAPPAPAPAPPMPAPAAPAAPMPAPVAPPAVEAAPEPTPAPAAPEPAPPAAPAAPEPPTQPPSDEA